MRQCIVLRSYGSRVAALQPTAPSGIHGLSRPYVSECFFSFCFLPPKKPINPLELLFICVFSLLVSLLPVPDKTCQWHFQYDRAQAKKAVCKLWEGEGTLRQVFWTVVWVWPGGVCGAPHLPDVSLPTRAYKLIPQTYVTAGLHHCAARYFCKQRKIAPLSCLSKAIPLWPALLQKSLLGSVCKIDDSFWIKSSVLVWNGVIFYFVFLPSLQAWPNTTMVWLGVKW